MKDSESETKFDASLRMKLNETRQANSDSPIRCLVKLSGAFDEEKRRMLSESGITVVAVLEGIITIEGRADAIQKISAYDFVHSISLSQSRYPAERD